MAMLLSEPQKEHSKKIILCQNITNLKKLAKMWHISYNLNRTTS
jgi:hypothetical protein